MNLKSQKGYSIIEVIIVISILTIITFIAIPNFSFATRAANASSAISSLRVIATAESIYQMAEGSNGYLHLGALAEKKYIDSVVGGSDPSANTSTKSGYKFQSTLLDGNSIQTPNYVISAIPASTSFFISSGIGRFGVDSSGVIHMDLNKQDIHYTTPDELRSGTSRTYSN